MTPVNLLFALGQWETLAFLWVAIMMDVPRYLFGSLNAATLERRN
jgi:hypothetical protein